MEADGKMMPGKSERFQVSLEISHIRFGRWRKLRSFTVAIRLDFLKECLRNWEGLRDRPVPSNCSRIELK